MRKRIYILVGAVAAGVLAVLGVVGVSAQTGGGTATPTPTATATATATPSAQGERLNDFLNKLAGNLNIRPDQLRNGLQQTADQMIDEAVANGRLTQAQGDHLKQRVANGDGFFFGLGRFDKQGHGASLRGILFHGLDAVAGVIGIDSNTLLSELQSGKSLAQVAQEHGVSRDQLKQGLSQQFEGLLDKLIDQTFPMRGK